MNSNFRTSLAILLLGACSLAQADSIALDETEIYGDKRWGVLPYIFATETLGTAIGAGGYIGGVRQPQTSAVASAFTTSNDSWLVGGALNNFRFGDKDRTFFDLFLVSSHFTDQRFYNSQDSNNSSPDDFISGISNDLNLELTARFVLPLGAGKEDPLSVFRTREGLLISEPDGGRHWNPVSSGKTTLNARYFYRYRDLQQIDQEDLLSAETNGFEFWLDYDNTDFIRNASRGSRQVITLTRDFGWFTSSNSWTNLEFDASKYFNLGTSSGFRHQVLAVDFWTSNTLTWDRDKTTGLVNHRPPPGFGSTLGGYDRLRAYPQGRFHDKAAVYYGAELRLIPQINGLDTLPLIKYLDIDWWQLVAFAEAGRVGPQYNADLFSKDLQWDVGLSLRIMAFRQPLRLDWAISEEDSAIWAMYEQPFAR